MSFPCVGVLHTMVTASQDTDSTGSAQRNLMQKLGDKLQSHLLPYGGIKGDADPVSDRSGSEPGSEPEPESESESESNAEREVDPEPDSGSEVESEQQEEEEEEVKERAPRPESKPELNGVSGHRSRFKKDGSKMRRASKNSRTARSEFSLNSLKHVCRRSGVTHMEGALLKELQIPLRDFVRESSFRSLVLCHGGARKTISAADVRRALARMGETFYG